MENKYHREIVAILLKGGEEGMSPAQISKAVFELHGKKTKSSLDYDQLHDKISSYLNRQSKMRRSVFKHVKTGIYAIKSDVAIQMDLFYDYDDMEENY